MPAGKCLNGAFLSTLSAVTRVFGSYLSEQRSVGIILSGDIIQIGCSEAHANFNYQTRGIAMTYSPDDFNIVGISP